MYLLRKTICPRKFYIVGPGFALLPLEDSRRANPPKLKQFIKVVALRRPRCDFMAPSVGAPPKSPAKAKQLALAPSSSGQGHLVLIQEIRGSTPLGATIKKISYLCKNPRQLAEGFYCLFFKNTKGRLR